MSGNSYLIDTNIAIYLLAGDPKIAEVLDQNQIYISFVSELELLSFRDFTDDELDIIQDFLNNVIIIDINTTIKARTIKLRKKRRIKLPDAIVAATAHYLNIPLLTADKQFKSIEDVQIIIYSLYQK